MAEKKYENKCDFVNDDSKRAKGVDSSREPSVKL